MRKKRLLLPCLLLVTFIVNAQKKAEIVGGKKDKQGCIASAGYQWSEIKHSCIRPFELPVQLHDSAKKWSASFIVEQDGKKAEVFCKEGHFMLTLNPDGSFGYQKRKRKLSLYKSDNLWTLKCKDVVYTGYLD